MIIVGDTYTEECDWPRWSRIMGPGTRAALAVSVLSPNSELYTYADKTSEADLKSTLHSCGVKCCVRLRDTPVRFLYKHPLFLERMDPEGADLVIKDAWDIQGPTVLAFKLMEAPVHLSADRAIIEISDRDNDVVCKQVKELALIASLNDFPEEKRGPSIVDFASTMMAAHNANLMIVRNPIGGGTLFYGDNQHDIPAYGGSHWFKIGMGNVFCAVFAHYWGERKLEPVEAANIASKSAAYYAETKTLPIPSASDLPALYSFNPDGDCTIFVATPVNSMAQHWLLDETIQSFTVLGIKTITPYELGLGDGQPNIDNARLDGCNAVLALSEGVDLASIFAAGVARVRNLPIVVLAEDARKPRLDLWQGTGCEIASDLSTAVFRAILAGKRNSKK